LSEKYNNVTGIDISPEQVAFCKKHVTQNIFCTNYEPWLDGKQYDDIVVINEILAPLLNPKIISWLKRVRDALVEDKVLLKFLI
jgi:2-polyprenyl-3-methyl-5-hydroxy-6-metoxy-1,4-benzoquinol methylase